VTEDADYGQFGTLAPFYDELMSTVPYEHWVEYVRLLWSVHGCSPASVLDAACGTGSVSLELARQGYAVVGVDLSEDMIAQARARAASHAQGTRPQFEVADLRTLFLPQAPHEGSGRPREFEAATCLYDSLNYILEPSGLRAAFERVGAHVRPGGVWVFDINTPWAFEADLFTQSNSDPRRDLHYSWHASFDRASRVCTVQMRFLKAGSEFLETHHERAYEMGEVEDLLGQSGWALEKAYDAYTLNPPHKKSERWYFAARRL
jgi:SAM-dependent methyltransferase